MKHSDQIECGKRLLAHIENGTTDMTDKAHQFPTDPYVSPERAQQEVDQLFKKHPILVGFSTDFPKSGSYRAETFAGVPTLILRDANGEMKAYLNICPHRTTPLAEGCGVKKRFTCPYHAWTFGMDGKLVNIPADEGFVDLDRSTLNLRPLPIVEKYGMIWVGLTADASVDIDSGLGDLKSDFEAYGYDSYVHYKTFEVEQEFNWKVSVDTFLETYHLRFLHRNSIKGAILSNLQLVDATGHGLREVQPRDTFEEDFKSKPEAEWDVIKHSAIAYVLFPNTIFIMQSDHVEIWRAFPDRDNPNRSKIYFDVYVPEPPQTEKAKRYWDANIDYGVQIVLKEDFPLGETNQIAYRSGAATHVNFGKNEPALTYYHTMIREQIEKGEAEDNAAPSLALASSS